MVVAILTCMRPCVLDVVRVMYARIWLVYRTVLYGGL